MLNISKSLSLGLVPITSLFLGLCPALWGCNSQAQTIVKPSPAQMQPSWPGAQNLPITAQLVLKKKIIHLEVANTKQQQAIGLMFRRSMPKDRGMLFNFNSPQPAQFWMKNTLISLDMLFLSKGVIKNIQVDVPSCSGDPCPSYGPPSNILIDQVIELNAGQVATLGLKVGDKLLVQKVRRIPPLQR